MAAPRHLRFPFGFIAFLVCLVASEGPGSAQTSFTTRTDFQTVDGSTFQGGLVPGADGDLYGTSAYGGRNSCNCGTLYKVDRYGILTTVHSFSGVDGANPNSGLVPGNGGDLFGTTRYGGAHGNGAIFKLTSGGRFVLLHSLNNGATPRQGTTPSPLAKASDGNFYGVTLLGGSYLDGTIFRVTPTGAFSVLHALNSSAGEGFMPVMGLVEANDGRLYGAAGGGAYQNGLIFSVDRSNGAFIVEHTFAGWDGAQYPEGRNARSRMIQGRDGKLWGTTVQGGRANGGTIYTFDPATRTFTSVHHMAPLAGGRYPEGYYASSGLIEGIDGNFYGVASGGGPLNGGTIYRVTPAGVVSVIHAFDNNRGEGVSPIGELLQTSDGRLYGTNTLGWPNGGGVLFAVETDGSHFEVRHVFSAVPASPWSNVVKGSDGNLYGASAGSGRGVIFRILPDGTYQVLHAFLASDGWSPEGGLVEGPDGNFYGTTVFGGLNDLGTIYRITADGRFTLLHSFAALDAKCNCYPEGYHPRSTLVLASDGNLYGTATHGGLSVWGYGTVFRITPGGSFSVLHKFGANSRDGRNPYAGLTQGADGRLYGSTHAGGMGWGTLFAIDFAGRYTKLYDFKYSEGFRPYASLTLGSNGTLYGSAYRGGPSDGGAIFRFDSYSNSFTTLTSFVGVASGRWPLGGVTEGSDGFLYGTTHRGGAHDRGTFFRLSAGGGAPEVLLSFNNSTAGVTRGLFEPHSTPSEFSPGTFVGTAYLGGISGRGGVYQLTVDPARLLAR